MSEEEIKKQYANGIVNADEVIKSLIDKFKTDKTSVDIQQLQLIAEYLLYKVDKLQKEKKKYIDIFNSTEKIMNGQERTKDKLLKENVELQKDNYKLDRENQHFFDRIQDLQKENEELKEQGGLEKAGNINLQTVLEELQKENKEYQELTDNLRGENAELRDKLNKLKSEYEVLEILHETYNGKYISKDEIRELAQEYKPNQSNTFIESQERYIELVEKLELLGE